MIVEVPNTAQNDDSIYKNYLQESWVDFAGNCHCPYPGTIDLPVPVCPNRHSALRSPRSTLHFSVHNCSRCFYHIKAAGSPSSPSTLPVCVISLIAVSNRQRKNQILLSNVSCWINCRQNGFLPLEYLQGEIVIWWLNLLKNIITRWHRPSFIKSYLSLNKGRTPIYQLHNDSTSKEISF